MRQQPHPNLLYTRHQTDTFTLPNNQWAKRYSELRLLRQVRVSRIAAKFEESPSEFDVRGVY